MTKIQRLYRAIFDMKGGYFMGEGVYKTLPSGGAVEYPEVEDHYRAFCEGIDQGLRMAKEADG